MIRDADEITIRFRGARFTRDESHFGQVHVRSRRIVARGHLLVIEHDPAATAGPDRVYKPIAIGHGVETIVLPGQHAGDFRIDRLHFVGLAASAGEVHLETANTALCLLGIERFVQARKERELVALTAVHIDITGVAPPTQAPMT